MAARIRTRNVWWLYRAYNAAGDLLYIGQTGRDAIERWAEHMAAQPWAHEVAMWVRDPVEYPSEAAVLLAERDAIHAEAPRYNIAHNGTGRARTVQRRAPQRPPVRRVSGWVRVGRWCRAHPRLTAWSLAWLVLAVVLMAWSHRTGLGMSLKQAGAGAGAIVGGAWWFWGRHRPQRRRRRR